MNLLYVIGAVLLAGVCVAGAQEIRIVALGHELRQAREGRQEAQDALAAYQEAASTELARRLAENAVLEMRQRKEIDDARQSYEKRLAAINARGLRLRPPAAGDLRPVPAAAAPGGGAMDGPSLGDGFPLCVRADRGPELANLLREAEVNTAKLIECQRGRL